jgi:hypothetical protein
VVRVVAEDVTCSGTLITDNLVLTAHHCVAARDHRGRVRPVNVAPSELQIELGGDYLPWGEVRVRAVVAPDCGYVSGEGDLAILVLSRRLIGMPTVLPRLDAPPELEDQLSVHGFGRCALVKDPVHRVPREAETIKVVNAGQFEAQATICPGDSGGPAFSSAGDLIGVVSAAVMHPDGKMLDRAQFTRLDVWRHLFSAAHEISLGASPSELPPFGECRLAAAAEPRGSSKPKR